jgi:hypothetical protein
MITPRGTSKARGDVGTMAISHILLYDYGKQSITGTSAGQQPDAADRRKSR